VPETHPPSGSKELTTATADTEVDSEERECPP